MSPTDKQLKPWPPASVQQWDQAERDLMARIQAEDLPRHVAVIMDGNGRWASRHGFMDRIRGHQAGIEAVREITRTCAQLGIETLTLYTFSKENWQRPKYEVAALMALLGRFVVDEREELMENGIRLKAIGDLDDLPESVRTKLDQTIRMTQNNTGTTLALALSYGSRDEIVRAVRRCAREVQRGELDPERIDEAVLSAHLDTGEFPDPDLLVRTSGEHRVSNFLLWQIAYTELHVTDVLWPDFRRRHLLEALIDYKDRDRRFGRTDPPDLDPRGRER